MLFLHNHLPQQRHGYLLLFLTILLFVTYILAMFVYALQFLSVSFIPNQTLGNLANILLDVVIIVGLIGGASYAFTSDLEPRFNLQIWCFGLLIMLLGLAGFLFREYRISHNIYLNIGCPVAIVSLGFWLMRRFSNISPTWANLGVRVVAGELALAGVLLTLAQIFPHLFGYVAAGTVPLMASIFAAHSYRALSDRNHTRTLAAHWYALGVLLFLLGAGFMGAVLSLPEVSQAVLRTHLPDLQTMLTRLAFAMILLGVANQSAAELRAVNWRVTGLMPFWLVSFGIIIGAIGLGGAGLVQIYLLSLLGMDVMWVHVLLRPLYSLWCIGQGLMVMGMVIYTITFWLRKPSNILSNLARSPELLE